MGKLLVVLAIAAAVVLLLVGLSASADRARLLRRAGLGLTAAFTLVAAVWITAETFTDPGGWQAVGLTTMWLIPLALLLTISWHRVAWATPLLGVLTVIVVGLSAWFAADPDAWRTIENDTGPVRAISTLVLAAPIALLGRSRARPAGVLLVVLGVAPVALSAIGTAGGLGSLVAISIAPTLTGILYLLAEPAAVLTTAPRKHPPITARR